MPEVHHGDFLSFIRTDLMPLLLVRKVEEVKSGIFQLLSWDVAFARIEEG